MDVRLLVIDLIEKASLLVTAGLVSVITPPLRNRLLGLGRPRDRFAPGLLGVALAMWGSLLGDTWGGVHVHLRDVGVLLAAALGGSRAGLTAGALAGLFYVFRVDQAGGIAAILASTISGLLAGIVVERKPHAFQGLRALWTATGVVSVGVLVGLVGDLIIGLPPPGVTGYMAMSLLVALNACGIALMLAVARLVLQREEHARALVEVRAAANELALESLRRRLEPHFLFNALNTLRALIRTDPFTAREFVADLADLYRYLLHHPDLAKLRDEMEHARAYLTIERARLGGDRLRIETTLPDALRDERVPALLLQPIVENAVKHGIATRRDGGTIRIGAREEDGLIIIEVHDRGEGDHLGPTEKGSGIALAALRESLGHRYGAAGKITLDTRDGETVARVEFPSSTRKAS